MFSQKSCLHDIHSTYNIYPCTTRLRLEGSSNEFAFNIDHGDVAVPVTIADAVLAPQQAGEIFYFKIIPPG